MSCQPAPSCRCGVVRLLAAQPLLTLPFWFRLLEQFVPAEITVRGPSVLWQGKEVLRATPQGPEVRRGTDGPFFTLLDLFGAELLRVESLWPQLVFWVRWSRWDGPRLLPYRAGEVELFLCPGDPVLSVVRLGDYRREWRWLREHLWGRSWEEVLDWLRRREEEHRRNQELEALAERLPRAAFLRARAEGVVHELRSKESKRALARWFLRLPKGAQAELVLGGEAG